jgi:hypothetical protein
VLELLAAAVVSPGFVGCKSFFARDARAVERPAAMVFACGDGNFYATRLRWSRWTAAGATASGVGHRNDCRPYCAAGHFHAYPLVVTLARPERCGRNRQLEFTRVSWVFASRRPRGVARNGSESFRCA